MRENDGALLAGAVMPLLYWYRAEGRRLPWRDDPTPYHVWVSEIMLQQTRVEAVKPYYERFLKKLPDIRSLAACEEDELLKLWEGLGYYSRVRNLQRGARYVTEYCGGELPQDAASLLKIPGIGPYTAGAISSIAFGEPAPAIDGNVLRVLSRLLSDDADVTQTKTKARYHALLTDVYPAGDAAAFTQSLMELGACVCVPNGAPHCEACPLADLCRARAEGREGSLPNKPPKKERRIEYRDVYLLVCDGRVALRRRPDKGLLARLYEFPNVLCGEPFPDGAGAVPCGEATHIFTHVEWRMRGYFLKISSMLPGYVFAAPEELDEQYALPSAFRAFREMLTEK